VFEWIYFGSLRFIVGQVGGIHVSGWAPAAESFPLLGPPGTRNELPTSVVEEASVLDCLVHGPPSQGGGEGLTGEAGGSVSIALPSQLPHTILARRAAAWCQLREARGSGPVDLPG
jgi:hypothetical protein